MISCLRFCPWMRKNRQGSSFEGEWQETEDLLSTQACSLHVSMQTSEVRSPEHHRPQVQFFTLQPQPLSSEPHRMSRQLLAGREKRSGREIECSFSQQGRMS